MAHCAGRTVTSAIIGTVAAGMAVLGVPTGASPAGAAPSTTRVNVSATGRQAAAHAGLVERIGARSVDVSETGRYVVFASESRNLVAGDTNGDSDVFLRDRVDGTTRRVSTLATGGQANDRSTQPAISDNGRWIVFTSEATNLVPGVTSSGQVYRKDRVTGAIVLASARNSTTTEEANFGADSPTVSDSGAVAFSSGATNLRRGMTPIRDRVYVRDASTRGTALACRPTAGYGTADGSRTCGKPVISADGRSVAFTSTARLVPTDTNGVGDVYVLARATGVVSRVSVGGSGGELQGDGSCDGDVPALDRSANVVAFTCSHHGHAIVAGAPSNTQVYVRHRSERRTYLLSYRAGVVNYGAAYPTVSSGGRFAAFTTATSLTSTPTHGIDEAYVWDIGDRSRAMISRSTAGTPAGGTCVATVIAGDGSDVVFESRAVNLVSGDTNDLTDVFVRAAWRS